MTPEQQQKVDAIDRTPIPMEQVKSSQIHSIGHNPETNTLAVRFMPRVGEVQGGLYHYGNVDAVIYEAFRTSESLGSFFKKNIRPNADEFPYIRIEEPVKEEPAEAA